MVARVGTERLVEMLLAGAPERILALVGSVSPEDAAQLARLRDAAAALALSLDPVTPSAELRQRVLAARPRPRRPQKPALIVLDMIQDYLSPGGPLEVPRAREIVGALKQRLGEARQQGIP